MSMPARMQHFVWVEGQTIIEVTANGPFDIVYVNPQDDPAKQAMKSSRCKVMMGFRESVWNRTLRSVWLPSYGAGA